MSSISPSPPNSATSSKFRAKSPKHIIIKPWDCRSSHSSSDEDNDDIINSPADSACNDYKYQLPPQTAPLPLAPWAKDLDESDSTSDVLVAPARCRSAPIPEKDQASGNNYDSMVHNSEREMRVAEEVADSIREEFMRILEKRREDADVSLCERMMEEMAAREEMEKEIEKLVGTERGLKRRRTIR